MAITAFSHGRERIETMTFTVHVTCDPSSAFRAYLDAHFASLEKKIVATQESLDALKTAVSTLVTDVASVNTDVTAILAKIAAGGLTTQQMADLDAAVTALADQNTAIEAADASLKAALP